MRISDYTPLPEDLFEPAERLIEIRIGGRVYRVPDNNTLLRCFQFLGVEPWRFSPFCWNETCPNCVFLYQDAEGRPGSARACVAKPSDGMTLTKLPESVKGFFIPA